MSDPLSAPPGPSPQESADSPSAEGGARQRLAPVPPPGGTDGSRPEPNHSEDGAGVENGPTEADSETPAARRRRRGSRGGRNRNRSNRNLTADGATDEAGNDPAATDASPTEGAAGAATTAETDGSEPAAVPPAGLSTTSPDVAPTGEAAPAAAEAATKRPAGRSSERNGRSARPVADTPPPSVGSGFPVPAGSIPPPPRPKIGDSRPAPPTPTPAAAEAAPVAKKENEGEATSGAPRERRRRSRGGGSAKGGEQAATTEQQPRAPKAKGQGAGKGRQSSGTPTPAVSGLSGYSPAVEDEAGERRNGQKGAGRERKGRPVGRYMMVVHVQPQATQIAVLEGRNLIEHYVSRPSDDANQIDGNIYLGRVQNVLPGMEAAFVDIGTPKNAVLYRGDVRYDKDDVEAPSGDGGKPTRGRLPGPAKDARIEQLLKPGQTVLCQVTKNPIGAKGARLAQEVSLPGRFVVLIPGSDTYGISKRLPDEERKRLRRILDEIRPEGHGLIVRTAAEGATADELRRDVERLRHQWERIDELARTSRTPRLLYREPGMAVRVIREEFNKDYRGVVIDDRELYEEVRDYVASISPELADRVEFAGDSDDPLPAFERYHVHEQVHKALDRKVWLPSGGSLIIERTEALTVIDVNTGKNVGKSNLEETVFKNNLEAAEEIARQLRLRDIGGIIVIDFIDMEIVANRGVVIKTFREALARDKTRTQVFDISELGLVEMTRKRISEGLVESFSITCPTCSGRGFVLDETLLS